MYKNVIKSILFAFVVTNVQNVNPQLSHEQLVLVTGVFKAELWPNLWFDLIPYENRWIEVSRLFNRFAEPVARKMLVSIPRIMACDYGVRIHWFLSMAVYVVGECKILLLHGHGRTGDCWTKLGGGLQRGLYTMLVVSSTLEKIHSIVGDDIDADAFYHVLLDIVRLFTQNRLPELTARLQNTETYMETLKKQTGSLQEILFATCRPRFLPLNTEVLSMTNDGRDHMENRYDICIGQMDFYIGYVSDHLTKLDFHYDRNSGQITHNVVVNADTEQPLRAAYTTGAKTTQAQPTTEQLDLVDGVYNEKHWRNIWFATVKDKIDWIFVDRLLNRRHKPGPLLKMRLIPQMLGCMYGVKFHWILSMAIHVIDDCKRLSRNNDVVNSGDCWKKLVLVLQEGSYTMLQVMRSLLYVHSTIGEDIDLDVFYRTVSTISCFINEHSVDERNVDVSPLINFDYVQSLQRHLVALHDFLTSYCQPMAYPQLNINELMAEFQRRLPGAERYVYYAYIMKFYMDDISDHLTQMGFHYDMGTGQTTFVVKS